MQTWLNLHTVLITLFILLKIQFHLIINTKSNIYLKCIQRTQINFKNYKKYIDNDNRYQ